MHLRSPFPVPGGRTDSGNRLVHIYLDYGVFPMVKSCYLKERVWNVHRNKQFGRGQGECSVTMGDFVKFRY